MRKQEGFWKNRVLFYLPQKRKTLQSKNLIMRPIKEVNKNRTVLKTAKNKKLTESMDLAGLTKPNHTQGENKMDIH